MAAIILTYFDLIFFHNPPFISVVNVRDSNYYIYQCYFSIKHLCLVYFCFPTWQILKTSYQDSFVYYSLFIPQHNLDFIMFKIQLLIVQKFTQNVVVRCFPLNLKHAQYFSFVCTGFFFLSRVCPKQNVLQIAIVTLLCWNKDIPDFINLMNTHFLNHADLQPLLTYLFILCASYWEYEFCLKSIHEYTPLDVMVIIIIVANHHSISLPQNLKQKWDRLFTRTRLSS